jgi:hypothetical protein
MYRHLWKCCLVALGLFLGFRGAAKADYTITTFDVPGAVETLPYGINDTGQIVGYYVASTRAPTRLCSRMNRRARRDGPCS